MARYWRIIGVWTAETSAFIGDIDYYEAVKILHVETGRHFLGGPQQVIYLIDALAARGFDNILVCPPGSGIDTVAREHGIRVHNLSCAGDLDLSFAYRLSQFIKAERPDLVHCHSRRGADVLGGLAASFADVPAVVSRRVDNTELRLVAGLRYRPFRKVIAISAAIADVLEERGIEADRIEVIRSAVDADAFAAVPDCGAWRREFAIPGDAFTIAAAGQLIPRKGHRFLLQAIADLAERHARLRLVIFGEGYLANSLRAQAASLGLGGVVQFAGFREDLDDYIGCFDLLVHPASAEGLGVVVLKAAAAGVAVVGCDAGGLRESVVHGETGLLVPAEDAAALRNAIASLMDDDERRRSFGKAGRNRMQNEFSIVRMADRHIRLYESLLDG
jgi:glycosyltransferase involved in cell wall biosynthesis